MSLHYTLAALPLTHILYIFIPVKLHRTHGVTIILFAWSTVDAGKENFFRFLIVNEEHEWMIAMEFRRLQWSWRSETEQYGCGGRCRSFFVDFDFCFVDGITKFQIRGFGEAFQIRTGIEQIPNTHAFQYLNKIAKIIKLSDNVIDLAELSVTYWQEFVCFFKWDSWQFNVNFALDATFECFVK